MSIMWTVLWTMLLLLCPADSDSSMTHHNPNLMIVHEQKIAMVPIEQTVNTEAIIRELLTMIMKNKKDIEKLQSMIKRA